MTVIEKMEFDKLKKELNDIRLGENAKAAVEFMKESMALLLAQRIIQGNTTEQDLDLLQRARQKFPTSLDCYLELLGTSYLRVSKKLR